MTTQVTLPRVPSQLIRLALADMAKVRKDKRYEINMGHFHRPNPFSPKRTCAVCLAGCVMAKTLKIDSSVDIDPCDLDDNEAQLQALDYLRQGYVDDAFEMLDIDRDVSRFNRPIRKYSDATDYAPFVRGMTKLADDLEAAGF